MFENRLNDLASDIDDQGRSAQRLPAGPFSLVWKNLFVNCTGLDDKSEQMTNRNDFRGFSTIKWKICSQSLPKLTHRKLHPFFRGTYKNFDENIHTEIHIVKTHKVFRSKRDKILLYFRIEKYMLLAPQAYFSH